MPSVIYMDESDVCVIIKLLSSKSIHFVSDFQWWLWQFSKTKHIFYFNIVVQDCQVITCSLIYISDMFYSTHWAITQGRSNNWASNNDLFYFCDILTLLICIFVIFCQCTYLPRGLLQGWFGTIFFYTFGALWEVWYALEIVEDYNQYFWQYLLSPIVVCMFICNYFERKSVWEGKGYMFGIWIHFLELWMFVWLKWLSERLCL